jgi:hypothetical protein
MITIKTNKITIIIVHILGFLYHFLVSVSTDCNEGFIQTYRIIIEQNLVFIEFSPAFNKSKFEIKGQNYLSLSMLNFHTSITIDLLSMINHCNPQRIELTIE